MKFDNLYAFENGHDRKIPEVPWSSEGKKVEKRSFGLRLTPVMLLSLSVHCSLFKICLFLTGVYFKCFIWQSRLKVPIRIY